MKILILASELDVGGAETHIETLCRELARRGEEVVVASCGGRVARRLARNGIKHITIKKPTRSPVSLLFVQRDIYKIIKEEKVSIVHAHTRLSALAACGACCFTGVPMVTTAHAFFSMTPAKARLSRWGELTATVSEDIKEHLVLHGGVLPDRIRVIENGVSVPCKVNKRRNGHTVVFVSRMDSDCSQGAYLLCEIAPMLAEKYPDLCLILVGGGEELEGVRGAAQRANRQIGRAAVQTAGRVDDPSAFFADADVFVGVSRAALEAMAHAIPVILLGNEGFLGLFDENNVSAAKSTNFCARGEARATAPALLSSLDGFFSLPDERRAALAYFCRETVKREYSAELMAQKTLDFYSEAIEKYRARGHNSKKQNKEKTTCEKRKKRILLCGYYRFGNLGDDTILCSVLKELFPLKDTAEICVLGAKKRPKSPKNFNSTYSRVEKSLQKRNKIKNKATQSKQDLRLFCRSMRPAALASDDPAPPNLATPPTERFLKIPCRFAPLLSPLSAVRELKRADVFIFGGGSLLQNKTSNRSLLYYLFLIDRAKKYCKRRIMLANGIGPITDARYRRASLAAVSSFDVISVRDTCSQRALARALPKRDINLFPDPALLLVENAKTAQGDPRTHAETCAPPQAPAHSEIHSKTCAPAQDRAEIRAETDSYAETDAPDQANAEAHRETGTNPYAPRDFTVSRVEKSSSEVMISGGKRTAVTKRRLAVCLCGGELARRGITASAVADSLRAALDALYAEPLFIVMNEHADLSVTKQVASLLGVSVLESSPRAEKTESDFVSAPRAAADSTESRVKNGVAFGGGSPVERGENAVAFGGGSPVERGENAASFVGDSPVERGENAAIFGGFFSAVHVEKVVSERRFLSSTPIFCPRDADGLLDLLACADLSLCMRYHAALFSVGAGIPTLALGGDRKLSSFCADAGVYPAAPTVLLCDPEKLTVTLTRALAHFEKNGAKIEEKVRKMRSLCSKSFKELINYINTLDFDR